MRHLWVAMALLLVTAPGYAQVYKCRDAQQNIIYSDSPCTAGHRQELTDIPAEGAVSLPANPVQKSAVMRQIDAAVKSAIATNNLPKAEALATTREHWEWIAEARRSAPQLNTSNSDDITDSYECMQARSSLEAEANKPNIDAQVLRAKRSLMYAACDLPEPIEIVNQAPGAVFPYAYGRNPYGYPRHPHRSHHGPGKPHNSGYTSPPYDRHMETPFGSRFIRPEDAPR
jgi:hypothetical protein